MTKQNPLKSVNQSFTIMNLQVGLTFLKHQGLSWKLTLYGPIWNWK